MFLGTSDRELKIAKKRALPGPKIKISHSLLQRRPTAAPPWGVFEEGMGIGLHNARKTTYNMVDCAYSKSSTQFNTFDSRSTTFSAFFLNSVASRHISL